MPSNSDETWFRQKLSSAISALGTQHMNPQFRKLQELLSSDPNSDDGGEVMVRFESGKVVPFHSHDTTIDDQDLTITKDAADGTVWYSGESIEAVWIHQESVDDL